MVFLFHISLKSVVMQTCVLAPVYPEATVKEEKVILNKYYSINKNILLDIHNINAKYNHIASHRHCQYTNIGLDLYFIYTI